MNFFDVLQEESILLESGIKIPKETTKAKILHHDDFDGVLSAAIIAKQLQKQGINNIKTDLLHDGDSGIDQIVKLAKRKGEMLIVVDFDRFKDAAQELAKKNIDVQTDHHQKIEDKKNSSSKSFKPEYGSDVMHITSTKAQNLLTGSDIEIMNNIDSANFGENFNTNIFLKRKLNAKDTVKDKKMRLAIITSSLLNQIARGKNTNSGAVKTLIKLISQSSDPSVIKVYTETKKVIDLAKEQTKLFNKYKNKVLSDEELKEIEEFNKKLPQEMRIGINKDRTIRKSEIGTKEPKNEKELSKENEKQIEKNFRVENGAFKLLAGEIGDSDKISKNFIKKYNLNISDLVKFKLWKEARNEAWKLRTQGEQKQWPEDKSEQKELIIPIWFKKLRTIKNSEFKRKVWEEATEKAKKINKNWPNNKEEQDKLILPIYLKIIDNYAIVNNANFKNVDIDKYENIGVKRKTENIAVADDFKSNRYLPFLDKKIAASIRDFSTFWQVSLRPDYYEKFKETAKKHGKIFEPEKIDLVTISKNAMEKVAREKLNPIYLKKKGFDNPEALSVDLKNLFLKDIEKSGGHMSIANMSMENVFKNTVEKYKNIFNRADKAGIEKIKNKYNDKVKMFTNFLKYDFKKAIQDEIANQIQNKISQTKTNLAKSLKEDIIKFAGIDKIKK